MKKIAAAFLAIIFCYTVTGTAGGRGCFWSERWDAKTLADKDASRVDFRPVRTSVHRLVRLRYIPPILFMPRKGPEFKTFEVICRIKEYSVAIDGDLNLTLVDPLHPEETMTAEVPDPDCPSVKKSPYRDKFRRVWDEFRSSCVKDGRIIADGKSRPVNKGLYTIMGVGFLDMPHLQEGAAPNYLELHPILSISRTYP